MSSGTRLSFHLQVVEKHSKRCFPEETRVFVPLHEGGKVTCPGLSCSDNTDVTWYKVKSTHEQDVHFHFTAQTFENKSQTSLFSHRKHHPYLIDPGSGWRMGRYTSPRCMTVTRVNICVTDKSLKEG